MKRLFYLCFLVLVFSSILYAVPNTITYQGKLIDNGIPAHGAYELSFAIYDNETGGNQLWPAAGFENHNVIIDNGLYTAVLGMGNPPQPITASVFNGSTAWLEVKVRTSVLPRIQIHSVPYSMQAERLSGVTPNAPGDLMMWDGTKWVTTEFKYYYRDADGDGYGDINYPIYSNKLLAGYVDNSSDCFDNDNTLFPPYTYYRDADGDGLGDPNVTTTANDCSFPAGYVNNKSDCDDNNSSIPYKSLYIDYDHDGIGSDITVSGLWCDLAQAASQGFSNLTGDCDDNDPTVIPAHLVEGVMHVGAFEFCDGKDNDCNGQIDEDCVDTNGIFVSINGSLNGPGSIKFPVNSINQAISIARTRYPGKPKIYISAGSYDESVFLATGFVYLGQPGYYAPGYDLYGGYDPTTWRRNTTIHITNVKGISGWTVGGCTIEGLNIVAPDATGNEKISYGIALNDCHGIKMKKCNITAGNGSNGSDGSNGLDGQNGGEGSKGQPGCENSTSWGCKTCPQPLGGAGGTSPCNNNGGDGGKPGLGEGSGLAGTNGFGLFTALGGAGGSSTRYGLNGANGQDGNIGDNGQGGISLGNLEGNVGLQYYPSSGTSGTDGTDGSGGGGGGGGGGGVQYCDSYGSGGGGGGGGGSHGTGGTGGLGGGGSFGFLIKNCSNITIEECHIITGNGGNGGQGGIGGIGGIGGPGGYSQYGGQGEQDDGGMGGYGGNGGRGGHGGSGGGGGGGPVIGIFIKGQAATILNVNNVFTIGNPGIGGSGNDGNNGQNGLKQDIYIVP